MVTEAEFRAELRRHRIVAILRGHERAALTAAGLTLLEAGIECIEVSLTSTGGLETLAELVEAAPASAMIGAGTVMTVSDVANATEAGAQFLVTPALVASVDEGRRCGLPVLGGALTPTEIIAAMERCAAVKLFPASTVGPGYLAALRGPFPELALVPVGGIDAEAASAFLTAGAIAVGVGSPLLGDAAEGGSLAELRRRALTYRELCAG